MKRIPSETRAKDVLPEELKALGKALRFLRMQIGWKQQEAASAAHVTKGMLSGYETGYTLPSLPTLLNILNALGADFSDFQRALNALRNGPNKVSAGLNQLIGKQVVRVPFREDLDEKEREIGRAVLEIAAYLQGLRTA